LAKRVNDARLESRNARAALEARSKPYYKALDREVHLGYRKGKKGGAWLVRYYVGGQRYKEKVFARADDFSDADGEAILDFWSAQKRAHEILGQVKAGASDRNIPVQLYTVADALEDYLKFLQAHRRDEMNARNRIKNHILPQLGECKILELTQRQIEGWHRELAQTPARVRCIAPRLMMTKRH
jgi:hypothetical protein